MWNTRYSGHSAALGVYWYYTYVRICRNVCIPDIHGVKLLRNAEVMGKSWVLCVAVTG